ncbi:major capsid protein [uncultured Caudovirales phage]|uniref:Major capsid protein n=1 Tax=uncultured Caudovirales phage TaxID=2100421 RepID=A0A6J5S278_9CAUD|nr:major capsid protein [uncultured Caudovirales phage]CAB4212942.1 major capsid protein [uncultured Caudovirales phage]
MSTLSALNPTLLDIARRSDANGKVVGDIVEILKQENPILEDMGFVEGNLETGHKTTIRTGLPAPTWRKMYGGVQPAKSTTVQITDTCGMLEAYAEVDKAAVDLNGNTAAFRLSEDMGFIQGMSDEFAQTLIYGNETTEPEAFTGFAPRYNSLSAECADNIINGSGAGSDNTSIWLVGWGPQTCHGIIPKNSVAGLQVQDKGQVTVENADGAGGRMEAYRTHYRWDVGLTVRDWRYVVRIANIDVSDLSSTTNQKALITLMIQAAERIPSFSKARFSWYVNRTIREKLRLGILERVVNNLSWDTVNGKRVMTFDDIQVQRCDAILNTEATVS